MDKAKTLIYFASDIIKEYCRKNPIDWASRELANGPGNLLTPTPAMYVYFDLLLRGKRLFTQSDYVRYAWEQWDNWREELESEQIKGIEARLYRNFYPSAIDSLHVWALLVETNKFALCELDTAKDSVGKTDITVWAKNGKSYKIALMAGSNYNKRWTKYKRTVRGEAKNIVDIYLPMERRRAPGNKRWYEKEDIQCLLA